MDYLTANLMMPIGGMLIAIFAGWYMRRSTLADELRISNPLLFARLAVSDQDRGAACDSRDTGYEIYLGSDQNKPCITH